MRLLSNPRTTVLSGRTATFQVGGQVPVPVSITQTATGTVTGIQFKDFGVLVDVVPNASLDGNVTLRLRTEVSQPDPTIGFQPVAGAGIIPGFTRRATVSEVTIARGGTIALGGLISTDNRKLITKVPVLGDMSQFWASSVPIETFSRLANRTDYLRDPARFAQSAGAGRNRLCRRDSRGQQLPIRAQCWAIRASLNSTVAASSPGRRSRFSASKQQANGKQSL